MKQSSVESRASRASKRSPFRFERIETWQRARAFNKAVYAATRKFPKEELFALTSQLRRASVSISSNIAEGSGRNSDIDFAHFLEIAYGSLMEVVSQLFIALDENYIAQPEFDTLADHADILAGKIVALSKSLGRSARISQPSTLVPRHRNERSLHFWPSPSPSRSAYLREFHSPPNPRIARIFPLSTPLPPATGLAYPSETV